MSLMRTGAAVPAAEQLIPSDTFLLLSVPDWDRAAGELSASAYGRLWADPAMKPFREHFEQSFTNKILGPLEKELGIKLADFKGLPHGQMTFALTKGRWDGKLDENPGWLLLMDAREKSDQLKTVLADLKKRWVESKKQVGAARVRDIELTSLAIGKANIDKLLRSMWPDEADDSTEGLMKSEAIRNSQTTNEVYFGQAGSMLIAGSSTNDIERVLVKLSGGTGPVLGDQTVFQADRSAHLGGSTGFLWVNAQPIHQVLMQRFSKDANVGEFNLLLPRGDKLMSELGATDLKTVAAKLVAGEQGTEVGAFFSVPEPARRGLLKLLSVEQKDSMPPGFIPSEALKFTRVRLDGPRTWEILEGLLTKISPDLAGVVQLGLASAGKDKDPNFDLKGSLIRNLGNDIMWFENKAGSSNAANSGAMRSLLLIGSTNAEQMLRAIKLSSSLLPLASLEAAFREQEFLGRRLLSLPLPDGEDADGKPLKREFNIVAHGGYLAMSSDLSSLEQFIRGGTTNFTSLRAHPGLVEGAARVGGTNVGYFRFENQAALMRTMMDEIRVENQTLPGSSIVNQLANQLAPRTVTDGLLNFALLPPFDQIARYFYFVAYGFGSQPEGFTWRLFSAPPPQLKK